ALEYKTCFLGGAKVNFVLFFVVDQLRSVSVDLNNDSSLLIDIPDALCERDKVKFTVHTKTTLNSFQKPDFSVSRQHEDFIWLHDTLVETEEYAGLIIPPAPPKPDFESPREKMHKLGEGEATMTKEEYTKMKQELEAEYLAVFKKTVQVHEIFLQRLSSHPNLSKDRNFQIFLEYDQDLSVRRKNAKEMFGGFFKNMVKSADEVLISGIKDVDEFFEQEKTFLLDYFSKIKDSTAKAEKMTRSHKNVADDYIHISATLNSIAADDNTKVEGRVASDQELKLTELLRYYMRDIQAAKDLLYRRARALADYENSNKALDKARLKSKDVAQAEENQKQCLLKFDKLSESGKKELTSFKGRRVVAFRKNLIEMAELEIKHAKVRSRSAVDSCAVFLCVFVCVLVYILTDVTFSNTPHANRIAKLANRPDCGAVMLL
uniref:Sorting nexin n=1 Tax=Pygocentrus nattereri TaxID=42514 RepID=A0AAR2M261_PYGNA